MRFFYKSAFGLCKYGNRQQTRKKVRYKMMDIIMLVFFATIANANDWVEIEVFGKEHEDFLCNYLEFPYGISSHDTIQRVFSIVPHAFLGNTFMRFSCLENNVTLTSHKNDAMIKKNT